MINFDGIIRGKKKKKKEHNPNYLQIIPDHSYRILEALDLEKT